MPVWGPPWKHLAADKKPGGHSKDLKDLIWQEPCGLGVGQGGSNFKTGVSGRRVWEGLFHSRGGGVCLPNDLTPLGRTRAEPGPDLLLDSHLSR